MEPNKHNDPQPSLTPGEAVEGAVARSGGGVGRLVGAVDVAPVPLVSELDLLCAGAHSSSLNRE